MMHHSYAVRSRMETRLPSEQEPEFQIAPMIDILLVLLIFFMAISSTEVLQKIDPVDLPMADTGLGGHRPQIQGQVVVNVLWAQVNESGSIQMDGRTYARAEEIIPKIRAAVEADPHARVLVRADKHVRYEFLKTVMVAAGQAGASKLTFSVVDENRPPTVGPE